MMLVLTDDDVPKWPDPLDDMASAQARRALLLAADWGYSHDGNRSESERPWPVIHP
jgi:hypothetical protein